MIPNKIKISIFLILIIFSSSVFLLACTSTANSTINKNNSQKTIKIAAMGDLMLGTKNLLPPDDGKGSFDQVKSYLKDQDIVFGNIEAPLTDKGTTSKKEISGRSYVFKMPPHYVNYFFEAGFNLVSLANNHVNDYGAIGYQQSLELLKEKNIAVAGTIPNQIASKKVGETTVTLIAFATSLGCQNLNDIPAAVKLVKQEAAKDNTIVIVSFHGGAEGSKYQRVPQGVEMFLGENRGDLRKFSHAVIEAGAHLVIGHGPHVPRGLEIYKKRLIAYSLGNFATAQGLNVKGLNGQAPLLIVELSEKGDLLSGQVISFNQSKNNRPVFDPQNQAAKTMAKLSLLDFPDSPGLNEQGFVPVGK